MGKIKVFEVDICEDCLALKGQMCHTPECVFIRCTMDEAKQHLSMLLIRMDIDGEVVQGREAIRSYEGMQSSAKRPNINHPR
ncbi:MAG: hypothetical protein KBD16_00740 [Candidatus Pacebacteria bacterium]|nr:hypothetical protein [Candidatus Paceibacterota bacterium]